MINVSAAGIVNVLVQWSVFQYQSTNLGWLSRSDGVLEFWSNGRACNLIKFLKMGKSKWDADDTDNADVTRRFKNP